MAKFSPTSARARLRSLEKAKERAATLKRGETMTAQPMSKLIGVSWPVLRGWCDEIEGFEESGAFERGANGIEYTFRPRRVIAYLVKHFTRITQADDKKRSELTRAAGLKVSDQDEPPGLQETKDLVNLTITVVQASEKQKLYVLAEDMADFITGYNEAVLNGILGIRTKIDPNGNFPPKLRQQVDEYVRSVAAAAHASAEKFVRTKRAGIQQTGIA